jgi:hypothetical protein
MLLNKAHVISKNNLIKSAQEWFAKILMDIRSEAGKLPDGITGEKEEFAIILDSRTLEYAHFEKTFIKYKCKTLEEFLGIKLKSYKEKNNVRTDNRPNSRTFEA